MAKILVVDDDPNIAALVAFKLEKAGYQVVKVGDGEEALRALEANEPDLVVMDVMMPKLDGCSATRRMRRMPQGRDVPIILLSAKGQDSDRDAGLAAGATDYMTKPFTPAELVERVRQYLEDGR